MTGPLIASGLLAGALIGGVLRRADLCFHSMFRRAWSRDLDLVATWLYGIAIAAVGLSALFALGIGEDLNRGLAFDPVANIVGGVLIGVGMVVARSCVSGLFYKLGAGMVGAAVGLVGWGAGELAVRNVDLPGHRVLGSGDAATITHALGIPRLAASLVLVGAVAWWVTRRRSSGTPPWRPPVAGAALGAATIAAWALAGWAGASFGPSTVGVATYLYDRVTDGRTPSWWLVAFVVGIVVGSFAVSAARRGFELRWESTARLAQLGIGGALLGAGGRIAGGCNLGHGLSGAAQLNVSSWVAVLAMAAGVGIAARFEQAISGRSDRVVAWGPAAEAGLRTDRRYDLRTLRV